MGGVAQFTMAVLSSLAYFDQTKMSSPPISRIVSNVYEPLLVEIERSPGSQLGISLAYSPNDSNAIIIDRIKQASIADRCGALHVNDQLVAIDGTKVEDLTLAEVIKLLTAPAGQYLRLEILPLSHLYLKQIKHTPSNKNHIIPLDSSFTTSLCSTMDWVNLQYGRNCLSQRFVRPATSNSSLTSTIVPSNTQMSHPELVEIPIRSDHHGFGFAIQTGPNTVHFMGPLPVIGNLDPDGLAWRTGLIQVGDRVIAVNGQLTEGRTVEEVTRMILESKPTVNLLIEFDVAESVVPNSGTFVVKVAKSGGGLGITVSGRPGELLTITDICKGSAAHRTGTIERGDRLLAIDSVSLENCTPDDATQVLANCNNVVKLLIRKDIPQLDVSGADDTVHCVKLQRHEGALGITISGSEDGFEPILISGLTAGGIAEQTGVLQIGDRLLAINGHHVRGKPLSSAISLLQHSGDAVIVLQISKGSRESIARSSSNISINYNGDVDLNLTPSPTANDANLEDEKIETLCKTTNDSEWDETADGSQRSECEDREWANMMSKFEACSRQLNDLHLNSKCDDKRLTKSSTQSSPNVEHPPPTLHSSNAESSSCFPVPIELRTITLFKDKIYEDFGFSVSDGLSDHGVYINRIRPGGPADINDILQPFDRILQVNGTNTHDYDCCLTVPLMAVAGDQIDLVIARNPYATLPKLKCHSNLGPWKANEQQLAAFRQPQNSTNQQSRLAAKHSTNMTTL